MTGYFIRKASNLEEVKRDTQRIIALGGEPQKIKVIGKVTLSKRDFDNYTSDFFKEQKFITSRTEKCGFWNDVFHCIIVTCRETGTRLAVNTEGFAYSRYVALINE